MAIFAAFHESLVMAPVLVKLAGGGEEPVQPPADDQLLLDRLPRVGEFVRAAHRVPGISKFADALLYALWVYDMGHDGPARDEVAAFAAALDPDEDSMTRELSVDQWEYDAAELRCFYDTLHAFVAFYKM